MCCSNTRQMDDMCSCVELTRKLALIHECSVQRQLGKSQTMTRHNSTSANVSSTDKQYLETLTITNVFYFTVHHSCKVQLFQ